MNYSSGFASARRVWLATAVAVVVALGIVTPATAQETTGRLVGVVTMKADATTLPGVTVEAIHVPTGTRYSAVTNATGRFNILNVRVGGPYTVSAKASGFKEQTLQNINVALGESRELTFAVDLESVTGSVIVTAAEMPLITPDRMGSGSAVPESEIKVLPTIRRQFQDLVRTNPYLNVSASDPTGTSVSISGKNNRYNTIQIDGAVNNDIFGLAATGTPGGQTDTQPINLDSIQEIQLVVSPYDIKQGGFTGGAINAITRSGSNTFSGSVYGSKRNENWVGSNVPQLAGDSVRKPIAVFSNDQYGGRLGGPILKDQLFFFVSGEVNHLTQPTGVSADGTTATVFNNPTLAQNFKNILQAKYGYDAGSLGDVGQETPSNLFFGRLDFNIGPSNNATLRHNYVDAAQDIITNRNTGTYTFPTGGYTFADKTNSTVLQVNTVFGAESFNAGRLGYQTIKDNRQVPAAFPGVYVCGTNNQNSLCSGNGTYLVSAGTERSSGANALDQSIFELTDDFTLIKGNHTITLGTHNEFFHFKNLFLQDVFGTYYFNSLNDLQNGTAARYQVSFATGADPRRATADFGAQQWGLYISDQWRVNNSLTVSLGVRADLPRLTDKPSKNQQILDTYGIDTSDVPSGNLMISPRLGFNWAPSASGKDQVRGGIGVFAGRPPFVWISNNYGNTGIEQLNLVVNNVTFNPDPNSPPRNFPPGSSALQVNGIDPDFKFPRILRTTLAYDRELPYGIRGSVEAMFTKTLQDIFYTDVNQVQTGTLAFDGSPIYNKKVSTAFSQNLYLTNTTRGEQQNYSIQLEKRFPFGLYFSGSYAYMNAKAAFEGTSSVAYSNWRFYVTDGDIFTPALTRSSFEVRDRINLVLSQSFRTGPVNHNAAFVFIAQTGQPYSILMGGDPNKDGEFGNDLIFVPNNYSDVIWKGAGAPTEADWNAFLSSTGLDAYRGRIAPRNGVVVPWAKSLDFHYDIEVPIFGIRPQIIFDLLNVVNFIDHSSGIVQYVSNQTYTAVTYSGIDAASGKPIYTVNANALAENRQYAIGDLRSRWQMKLGARISF